MLLFTLGVSLAAGLLFGAIPVFKYPRPHMASALKDSSRGSSEGRERHRARNVLVVAQVALAAVLLVASGLMVRTFLSIREVPPGFVRPAEVLTFRVSIPQAVVEDNAQTARLYEEIARKIAAVGGVESVGLSTAITMDTNSSNDPIWAEDFPSRRRAAAADPPLQARRRGVLRNDGQSDHRRPRDHVERCAQRGAGGDAQRKSRA